jgi:CBS domain-containing protein
MDRLNRLAVQQQVRLRRDRHASIVAPQRRRSIRSDHSRASWFPAGRCGTAPMAVGRGSRTVALNAAPVKEPTMSTPVPAVARLDLMTVEEHMHAGVVACDPRTPLTDVAEILSDHRIHCVVVAGIDTSSDGSRLTWGTLTDRDLIRALDSREAGVTAGPIAATEIVTVDPSESLDRAVQLMNEHEITHLVVVEKDFPVGVISSLDIARAACVR